MKGKQNTRLNFSLIQPHKTDIVGSLPMPSHVRGGIVILCPLNSILLIEKVNGKNLINTSLMFNAYGIFLDLVKKTYILGNSLIDVGGYSSNGKIIIFQTFLQLVFLI